MRRVLFERRSERRELASGELAITWRDESVRARHARVEMINLSGRGVAFRASHRLEPGDIVGVRCGAGVCRAVVRHSRPSDSEFIVGVELYETYRLPIAASLEPH